MALTSSGSRIPKTRDSPHTSWINETYPASDEVVASSEAMLHLLETAPYPWLPFLLIAVLPAICEELAFRGFILSGLRRLGHKWWAVVLSSIFFGMAHTVLQQSLAAAVVGVAIGYLAVQTGSLVPCILFHMTYNGLNVLLIQWKDLPDRVVERLESRGARRRGGASHTSRGDSSFDYSYSQETDAGEGGIAPGTRVRHPVFGAGQIVAVQGAGLNQKLKIRFDRVGMKTVVVRYANLELA